MSMFLQRQFGEKVTFDDFSFSVKLRRQSIAIQLVSDSSIVKQVPGSASEIRKRLIK